MLATTPVRARRGPRCGGGPSAVVRWLLGYGAGLLGGQAFIVTLTWAITQSASPSRLGLVLAAGAVPRAVLLPFGGVAADRHGPKRTALLSEGLRVLVAAAVTTGAAHGAPAVPLLLAASVCFGVADALFLPASGAMATRLVARDVLGRVQSTRTLVQRLALVAAPPLAGLALAEHGYAVAFSATVVLFAVSWTALLSARLRSADVVPAPRASDAGDGGPRGTGMVTDIAAGVRYVHRHPVLLPLLVVVGIAELAGTGPIGAGVPLLADARGWGAPGATMVLAGFGAGAVATTLGITALRRIPRAGIHALLALTAMGPALAAVGLAPTLAVAVAAAVVSGLCGGVCSTLIGVFVITMTDAERIGRVSALLTLATLGGAPLSYALTGLGAEAADPRLVLVAAGAVLVVVAACAARVGALRTADLTNPGRTLP